ncbi:MAG: hypothetical protein IJO91_08485 [Oscillospiraceae bacterium]|nr:hypothetical protein [Oscillospiraceae bacterium]
MPINYKGYNYSLQNHQELINIISDMLKNGESIFPRKKLASKIGKSVSWISLAINQINREEICIDYDCNGLKLNYTDLSQNGVFAKIHKMLKDTEDNPELVYSDNKTLCEKYHVCEKTVQMYRAYALY